MKMSFLIFASNHLLRSLDTYPVLRSILFRGWPSESLCFVFLSLSFLCVLERSLLVLTGWLPLFVLEASILFILYAVLHYLTSLRGIHIVCLSEPLRFNDITLHLFNLKLYKEGWRLLCLVLHVISLYLI